MFVKKIKKNCFVFFIIIITSNAFELNKNVMQTWKNSTYYGFRGIKYAKSPTGSLRYKAPVPVSSWGNISFLFENSMNADGSDCPSPSLNPVEYNEDCLYLNVYTKNLTPKKLRPVVIFIHPGGLYVGSGSSKNFGANYLLEEELVLVTFNYRLGFFGFTSTGNADASGNAGFKDQVLVMKWVQDHIEHFGGDPRCVTLMGCSAGGVSIALHLVSPMSQGLFHRAFLMSGSILPQVKSYKAQTYLIERLAALIGCNQNINEYFECIKNGDTKLITESLRKVFDFGWDNPVYRWLPVIEPKIDGEEQFLSEDPMKLLMNGQFNKVPLLISITKNELSLSALYLLQHRDALNQWTNEFNHVGPICLQYEQSPAISSDLWLQYVKGESDRNRKSFFDKTAQCFSDALVNFPVYRLAQLTRNYTDLYFMRFMYRGSLSSFNCKNSNVNDTICQDIQAENNIEHGDDLNFLFSSKNGLKILPDSSIEAKIVEKSTKLLMNFAEYGFLMYENEINPNLSKFDDKQVFVNFGENFSLDNIPFKQYKLWDKLFPIEN